MRTISADRLAILAGAPKNSVRFFVKDGTGTWRDLTSFGGVNLVEELTWGETVDDDGCTATATLSRGLDLLSPAPLIEASPFNHLFNHANAYSPLIAPNREMKIEFALQAEDDPAAKSWELSLHGYLDKPNTIEDKVVISARGLQAKLVINYVERERIYAYAQGANATKGLYVFEKARVLVLNELVVPTEAKLNGHFYRVTTAGTTSSTAEPAWPTGSGATVTSGTVTFTEVGSTSTSTGTPLEDVIQQFLTDIGSGVTLWCPVSPSFNVRWFKIERQCAMTELAALAASIGWCLRYVYDSGTSAFRLKLYDPNRSTTTSLHTFTKAQVRKISKAEINAMDVRNAVQLIFSDSQDLDASGFPKRKVLEVTDSASITKFGRQFAELQESSSSNIDTTAEATALANKILSDMKDPICEVSAEVTFFPFIELCDLYTLAADGVHYDTDQKLAVSGYEHRLSAEGFFTTIELRGAPSSGYRTWLARMTDVDKTGEVHSITDLSAGNPFSVVLDASALTAIGGVKGIIQRESRKVHRRVDYEIHLSTTASFTPSGSTLKARSNGIEFETGALEPGTTYYMQLVPIIWNDSQPVRGNPSVETSFVAGYAEPGHINPKTVKGPTPPNGGFEGLGQDISERPPSHWAMVTGEWKREIDLATGTGARTGGNALQFTNDTTTAAKIRSAFFPALADSRYALSAWVKKFGTIEAADNLVLAVEWYDDTETLISTSTLTTDLNSIGTGWTCLTSTFVAPALTQFAKVYVAKAAANNFTCYVDDVSLVGGEEPWHEVGASGEPAFENSWVNYNSGTHETAGFIREGVWRNLKGLVKDGTAGDGNQIFTLPAVDRPLLNKNFAVVTDTGHGRLEVQSSGEVTLITGGTSYASLDGVRWRVG